VVDFAKRTFGVPVLLGRLEALPLSPGFKCIAAFDVLEHLRDPLETMRRCAELLAPDGALLLQTPCYRGEGPEWSMFQPSEHIHLFTEASVRLLLGRAGFQDIRVAASLFPYDMWVVAAVDALPGGPSPGDGDWRMPAAFRALLDIAHSERHVRRTLRRTEADAEARLGQVEELTKLLAEAEADRAARLAHVEHLAELLRESEADRAARLEHMEELGRLLRESEADRAARLENMEELDRLLRESEAAREAHGDVIEVLRAKLNAIEKTAAWRAYSAVAARLRRTGPR
jgi:SAM-dependent methyltransferase